MASDYVKICPRCGHRNNELASACDKDGEFLGMVPAIPLASAPPVPAPNPEPTPLTAADTAPAPNACDTGAAPAEPFPAAALAAGKALYLDVEGAAQYYQVKDGWVVGQAHAASNAEIQLANVSGVNYIHRRHCAFHYADTVWRVKPLPQQDYTNPTFLNDRRLIAGEPVEIRNGDRLRLAGVTLRVRIIDL